MDERDLLGVLHPLCLTCEGNSRLARRPRQRCTGRKPRGARAIFWHACVVTALNPKSCAFFIAFVPLFIDAAAPLFPQMAVMVATFVFLAAANALAFALAADKLRTRIGRPSVVLWLNRAGGGALLAMAAATAAMRRV